MNATEELIFALVRLYRAVYWLDSKMPELFEAIDYTNVVLRPYRKEVHEANELLDMLGE